MQGAEWKHAPSQSRNRREAMALGQRLGEEAKDEARKVAGVMGPLCWASWFPCPRHGLSRWADDRAGLSQKIRSSLVEKVKM